MAAVAGGRFSSSDDDGDSDDIESAGGVNRSSDGSCFLVAFGFAPSLLPLPFPLPSPCSPPSSSSLFERGVLGVPGQADCCCCCCCRFLFWYWLSFFFAVRWKKTRAIKKDESGKRKNKQKRKH